MAEWILTDKDIGMDGAYYDYPELIRCKDCKRFNQGYCTKFLIVCLKPIDYCSRAERRTDNG